jgi:two-component system response regulator YesN
MEKTIHKTNLIQQVKQFIHENYNKQITLNHASDVVFINPSYLSRLFSEVEGCVFTDYVAMVRVEEAKKLLADRKYKIYEVADMVGYKSFKYFLKIFKEKEGLTPAQYREKRIFS